MSYTIPPSKQRLDALVRAQAVIPREHFKREADLLTTKWPIYRFMSPMRATLEFAREYRDAYKRCLDRHFDREHAKKANPIAGLGFTTNNKRLTQLWIARQHADERFIPYGQYLDFAFDFATRRTRKTLPQPNQLRPSPPEQTQAWELEFEKSWTADHINIELNRMSAMAHYAVENDRGLPAQTTYRAELLALAQEDDIQLRSIIGTHVVARRHVAPEDFAAIFGDNTVASAVVSAMDDLKLGLRRIEEYASLDKADLWQACCGVLGVRPAEDDLCRTCPQGETCTKLRALVERELVARHGSPDPMLDEKRRKGREDTARCRARKQANSGMAAASV